MKIIVKMFQCYCFIILFVCNCTFSKAQVKEVQLKKEDKNLLIINDRDTVRLKNVLIDEANGYFRKGGNNRFYLTYEYNASYNKSKVIYSLKLYGKNLIIDKIVHFNYNDREGIPYGWIYYCNSKMQFDIVNYDSLTGIESQMNYSSFKKERESCTVEISSPSNVRIFESKAVKKGSLINVTIPLFFKDGNYIGKGTFEYKSESCSDLCLNFPISFLESDYYSFDEQINIKNVRIFNDTAYYLEQGGNYLESICILKNVIEIFPNRIVAYINLGDAYWGLKEADNAKKAYQKYIELMKASGKESKIPQKVFERIR